MDYRPWTIDHGLSTIDYGPWTMNFEAKKAVDRGQWTMDFLTFTKLINSLIHERSLYHFCSSNTYWKF